MGALDNIKAITWPCDKDAQAETIEYLKQQLIAYQDEVVQTSPFQYLFEDEPDFFAWQAAWKISGNTLPIPDKTRLVWVSQTTNEWVGEYLVYQGQLRKYEPSFYKGMQPHFITDLVEIEDFSVIANTAGQLDVLPRWDSSNTIIGTVDTEKIIINITSNKDFRFEFFIPLQITFLTGTEVRFFYEIDGVLIPPFPDGVIRLTNNNSLVNLHYPHPAKLSAGTHEIKIGFVANFSGVSAYWKPLNTTNTFIEVIIDE